jgi:hypothetical protein
VRGGGIISRGSLFWDVCNKGRGGFRDISRFHSIEGLCDFSQDSRRHFLLLLCFGCPSGVRSGGRVKMRKLGWAI